MFNGKLQRTNTPDYSLKLYQQHKSFKIPDPTPDQTLYPQAKWLLKGLIVE